MSFLRDNNSAKDGSTPSFQRCSLPELYASVENFRKNRKKSILLKTHGISVKEAQKILSKNLSDKSFISRTGVKEDPQSLFMNTVVKKEDENLESMAELLHRTLLMDPLPPVQQLSKSQKRLAQSGIPPPIHTFPYNIVDKHSSAFPKAAIMKKIQSIKILGKIGLFDSTQEKPIYEDKVPRYFSVDPEKQFMDLRDLEWKYVKGLVKWKYTTPVSFEDVKYNTEKRFVESQNMPGFISPPLVHKSFVIYPAINFQKENLLKPVFRWYPPTLGSFDPDQKRRECGRCVALGVVGSTFGNIPLDVGVAPGSFSLWQLPGSTCSSAA
ncbi:uncharacterized protein C9orf153 homolog [Sciurus carolinensis]|uniref:uncharacterized protein C9orf153 homolog n=1 Tax=Sciurus carolinensis TaxID=30640 RepID=UPI001FB25224|nr:uncharacterized protein C9orf153 homolog [Sciurus carolinensis]